MEEKKSEQQKASTSLDKETVVVFGGNGTIAMAINEQLVKAGYHVVALCRHGSPPPVPDTSEYSWAKEIDWRKADALNPSTYEPILKDLKPAAVISSIGRFDPVSQMLYWKRPGVAKTAGDTNCNVCKSCKKLNIPKFIYISGLASATYKQWVLDNENNIQWYSTPLAWLASPQLLSKHKVEKCVMDTFDKDHGLIIRPALTFGRWYRRINLCGCTHFNLTLWMPPFSDWPSVQNFYRSRMKQSCTLHEVGDACIRFITKSPEKTLSKQTVDACEIGNFLKD